jgi:hypothetical protein
MPFSIGAFDSMPDKEGQVVVQPNETPKTAESTVP